MLPALHIPGPHLRDAGGGILWTWPGIYAEAILKGTGFRLCIRGPGRVLRLSIDQTTQDFGPLSAEPISIVQDGLSADTHLIRIQMIDPEAHAPCELISCEPLPGGLFLPAPQPRSQHFEFVGDSWTCGFGNRSPDRLDSDCTLAFPALVAKAFQADYALLAISGYGIAKNFGDEPPSPSTLVDRYPTLHDPLYYRRANQVVVLAGENDFSFAPEPSDSLFISRYRELLGKIRARHPQASILLLAVTRPHRAAQLTEAVYQLELADQAKDLQILRLPNLNPEFPFGYLAHPGLAHHRLLADTVIGGLSHKIAVTPRG